MVKRVQSDTLPLRFAAFRAMNHTLTCFTSCRHCNCVRTITEPQNTSKASGRDKIRNMCDKGTRTSMGGFVIFSAYRPRNITPLSPKRRSYYFQDYSVNRYALCTPEINHSSIDIKMQFTLNVMAILAATNNIVTAAAPRRYASVQYRPAQYGGNTVPWTSSTCSAVYSTITQTSSKPVTSVVTTTKYKPSTWTSTSPTVISSVYTAFKPATTKVITTITSTYIGM